MTPFILQGRTKLPPEAEPSDRETYDRYLQIWIDKETACPLVESVRTTIHSSQFGETTLTETREGTDQTEFITPQASPFGETMMTKTVEGADQFEVATLQPTNFGETVRTMSREGTDQTEITIGSQSDDGLDESGQSGNKSP